MEKTNWLAIAALTTVSFIYGANFSIAKIPMQHEVIQPIGFILLRGLAGFTLFWIIKLLFVPEKVDPKDYKWLLICGLTGVTINMSFFFAGLKYTNPVNGALVMSLTPIIVLILSRFMLDEKITWTKLLGIIIGLAGALLLILKGFTGFHWHSLKGDLMVLVNAVSFSFFLIFIKRLSPKYHPITLTAWVFTFGVIFLIPIGLPSLMKTEWSRMSQSDVLSIGYVLIFTTFLAYLLNTWAVSQVKPTLVSSFIFLQPLFALLVAVSLQMDQLSPRMLYSGVLIFIGLGLISKKNKEKLRTT